VFKGGLFHDQDAKKEVPLEPGLVPRSQFPAKGRTNTNAFRQLRQIRELETKLERQAADAKRSLEDVEATNNEVVHRLQQTKQELTDQLWQKGTELDAANSKLEALQRTLEERRVDIANYKEQLVAGAVREKELQRQVVQATLRGEQVRQSACCKVWGWV
jgi:predicted RNase H-like nuclease (RuvC/YqgF family)